MRLTQVRLKNFGPYEDSTFELGSGLVGIVGPNGSGKSTLVNGIYACLTNDFSRFAGRKAGIVRDMAGDKDKSFVEIAGEHENVLFTLRRNLRGKGSKLVMGDVSYTKVADIEKHLIKDLGLNRRLIDAYVFVNQWDMFQFLDQSDSKRAETFQYLCGTEKSTDIYDACTKYLNDKSLNTDVVDNADDINVEISAAKKELKQLKVERNTHAKKLMKDSSREAAVKIVSKWDTFLENTSRLDDYLGNAEVLSEDLGKHQEKLKDCLRVAALREEKASAAFKELSARREHKLLYDEAKRRERQHAKLQRTRESYEKVKPVLEYPDDSLCPTCGQEVQDKELRAIVEKEYAVNMAAYEEKLSNIDEQIQDNPVIEEHLEFDLSGWDLINNRYSTEVTRHKEARENVVTITAKIGRIEGNKASNDKQIESLKSSLQDFSSGEYNELYERAKLRLSEHTESKTKVDSLDGAISVTEESILSSERLLASLQRKLAVRASHDELLGVVDKARDLFHWQNLPRSVAQANLGAITGEINEALADFGNPFWVEADTNLSFKVHFPGAPPRPAGALSGGQKVVLAICFRAAVNRLFGDNIGMMFLDEPTSGLDDDNVEYFREVLMHMASKIRHKYQLFVVTHAAALSPAFDSTISIGA